MGIIERIKDIEVEIARTQKNKATNSHLMRLRAQLAKLRTEVRISLFHVLDRLPFTLPTRAALSPHPCSPCQPSRPLVPSMAMCARLPTFRSRP